MKNQITKIVKAAVIVSTILVSFGMAPNAHAQDSEELTIQNEELPDLFDSEEDAELAFDDGMKVQMIQKPGTQKRIHRAPATVEFKVVLISTKRK